MDIAAASLSSPWDISHDRHPNFRIDGKQIRVVRVYFVYFFAY